jgi:hypothetical protein
MVSDALEVTEAEFELNGDFGTPTRPDGPGFMPLTEAAHWIASKGGIVSVEIGEQIWKPAFDDLLAHIASQDVEVIGRRGAGNESVPARLFARIRVVYPYSDLPLHTMLGDEPYLDCYPFVDDDHWQREFNDKLYASGRDQPQWTHLQVKKSDVARLWPFELTPQERDASSESLPAGSESRKRGPKPTKLKQVKELMRREIRQGWHTPTTLRDTLEKNLAAAYSVSRDTARKARTAVMSELAEDSNSDKSRQTTNSDTL